VDTQRSGVVPRLSWNVERDPLVEVIDRLIGTKTGSCAGGERPAVVSCLEMYLIHRDEPQARNAGAPAPEFLTPFDTTLIPLGTQYGATLSNPERRKPLRYAGFAIPCTPLQRLSDHS
jgi:hypothetical protein